MIIRRGEDVFLARMSDDSADDLIKVADLRSLLSAARDCVREYRLRQERFRLPTFSARNVHGGAELRKIKAEINFQIRRIEGRIGEIETYNVPRAMKSAMSGHFSPMLRQIIEEYRSVQQYMLSDASASDDSLPDDVQVSDPLFLAEKESRVEDIRQTIFALTTMLMELRIAIGSQTEKIDRIDWFMKSMNDSIRKANIELRGLPSETTRLKNKVIFGLAALAMTLFFLNLARVSKERRLLRPELEPRSPPPGDRLAGIEQGEPVGRGAGTDADLRGRPG